MGRLHHEDEMNLCGQEPHERFHGAAGLFVGEPGIEFRLDPHGEAVVREHQIGAPSSFRIMNLSLYVDRV